MIELHNVLKFYKNGGHTKMVLDNVTAIFERGHSYGILGVNGAGKSTTLRLISGSEYPNAGKIKRNVRISWPLGFAAAFNPNMTARNNITFAARAYGQDVREVLDFVASDEFNQAFRIDAPPVAKRASRKVSANMPSSAGAPNS